MRNFTLGKNRIPLFFFALFLMIGTSSYGQCPTVTDQTPETFCYLSTVAELSDATGATVTEGEVAWYRTMTSTNPIPENELLQGGSYFAGNANGTCTDRVEVTVEVDNVGPPTSRFGITFQPCEYGEEDTTTVAELVALLEGNDIAIYEEEFSGEPLPPDTPLEEGENYFAGQFSDAGCPSSRLALRYDPIPVVPPTAEPEQTFCEGATVADLSAQATSPLAQNFRWYSTRTSFPPLDPSTPLIDGETYYASQIINRSDSPLPPCESVDRAEVFVELDDIDAGEQVGDDIYCISELEAAVNEGATLEDLFLSLISGNSTDEGEFTNNTLQELEQQYSQNPIGTYNTTYTVTSENGCTDSVDLSITIVDSYDVGEDNTDTEFCRSEFGETITEDELQSVFLSLYNGENADEGSFSGISDLVQQFNNGDGTGTFSTVFTIGEGTTCENSVNLAFTVNAAPFVGEPVSDTICYAVADTAPNLTAVREYYLGLLDSGVSTQGTFDPTIESIVERYNEDPIGDFSTTYTVTEGECSSSVRLTVTVTEEEPANAGTINDQEICSDSGPVSLYSYLTDPDSMTGGVFSGEGVDEEGNFDPSIGAGTYEITYTVDDSATCVTGEDSDDFVITVLPAPFSEDINEEFCINEARELIADYSAALAYFQNLLQDENITVDLANFGDGLASEGSRLWAYLNDPGETTSDTFTVTYLNESGNEICDDAEITINIAINNIVPATVSDIDDFEVCSSNQALDLFDYLNLTEGTFSMGGTVIEHGLLDISTVGELGPITYFVNADEDETDCIEGSDETDFNVTVGQGLDLGEPVTANICYALADTAPSVTDVRNYLLGLLGPNVPRNGTFTPSIRSIIADFNENPIREFETTYTVEQGNCTSSVLLTINVTDEEPANAGEIADQELCSSDTAVDLDTYLTGSGGMTGGTFSGTGVNDEGFFDPSIGAGTYQITYTVDESTSECIEGRASETFEIVVFEAPNAGENIDLVFCTTEIEALLADPEDALSFFSDLLEEQEGEVDLDGEFDTDIDDVIDYYTIGDFTEPFTTTYTVSNENCESQAVITLTINEVEQVEIGDINDFTVCSSNEQLNLYSYLGVSMGTFSTEEGEIEDGLLDISTVGELGPITYFVNADEDETDCVEGTDQTQFNVTVVEGDANAGEDVALEYCITEIEEMTEAEALAIFDSLLGEDVDEGGEFSPSLETLIAQFAQNPIGTFETTYTVGDGECQDSAELSITINDEQEANAGPDTPVTFCSTEGEVDLSNYLSEEANQNGFFEELEDNMFNPSEAGVGTYTFTYTVDTSVDCVVGEDSATYTVEVIEGDANAGEDVALEYCITEIEEMTEAEALAIFDSLLSEDVDEGGEFSPSLETLIAQFAQNPIGTFETTYTVGDGECQDSAELSITINDEQEANAGPDTPVTFCSTEGEVDLSNYLSEEANQNGFFEELEDNVFNPSEAGVGTYTFTYTVDTSVDCVVGEDSATYTVEVIEGANAGADNVATEVCITDVTGTVTETDVRNFYLGLLDGTATPGGTFNPSIRSIINQFTNGSGAGVYTTTYTVGSGECQDSAVLTVTVLGSPDAGQDATLTLEEDATEVVDLFEALGGTPDAGGVWTFDGDEIDADFDPATEPEGAYTYTVTNENGCTDTAVVTVQIGEPVACPEVAEPEQTFCGDATVADLLPADVLWYDTADAITPLADDTALTDGGEYFAGDAEGICEGREMVTVTISDAPAAPTVVTPFEDCVVTGATVADLEVTPEDGNTLTVYTDEAMETPAEETDLLVEGTYYIVQTNAAGCVSEPATITVTLIDSEAPTLVSGGNVFCEFDQATLADLEANVSGDGEITWYSSEDGTETLSTNEVLEDQVTYYAAMTDADSGCESSERLAVTVTLESCDIIIPEIFTPNGDGINDRFIVQYLDSEYPDFRLEVYNRWGEEVYIGNAGTPTWDGYSTEGSFGDGMLPVGVYFYILYFNDGETAPVQGRVYLSR